MRACLEMTMSWTDERVELLKKLWIDGLSASQIAGELGGVTRNAVIGKVHRLGLSGRAKSPSSSSAPRARKPAPRPTVPRTTASSPSMGGSVRGNTALAPQMREEVAYMPVIHIQEDVVVPMSRRVSIMELRESMCKWPMGDPQSSEFVYCGADCGFGKTYCTHHANIAYQPATERRRTR
jgi:GcrA cell cycle regulator